MSKTLPNGCSESLEQKTPHKSSKIEENVQNKASKGLKAQESLKAFVNASTTRFHACGPWYIFVSHNYDLI